MQNPEREIHAMGIQFYDRFVYRPEYGYSCSYYQERINQIIDSYTDLAYDEDPDNLIELYDTLRYISDVDNDNNISAELKSMYKSHIPTIRRILGVYFSKISDDNFYEIAEKIHPQYSDRFWKLMCHFKRIAEIKPSSMKAFLTANPHHLDDVLAQKEMAQSFSETLYNCFLESPSRISVLITALLGKPDRQVKQLYVKMAFTPQQMNTLFKQYIGEETANINHVRLIHISQNDPSIGLDDEVRLLAKRKEEKLSEKLLEHGVHIEHGLGVSFGPYDEWKSYKEEDNEFRIMYDSRWIEENLDYPTLLDNLIYWLEYADSQCRSNLPMRKHQISALEDITIVKGKKTYDAGHGFRTSHFLQLIQMQGYYGQLTKSGIYLEDVFKWFFEEYLPSEFGVDGFVYNAPTQKASYLEKCRLIAGEIESILKQFKLYRLHGHIDRELFEMSSEHLFFSQIPSLLPRKYVYAKSDLVKWCMVHLFDNCMLGVAPNGELADCDCLYEAMMQYKSLPRSAFNANYQEEPLQHLLSWGILVDTDGQLTLNPVKTRILHDLHDYGVLCYHHSGELQSTIAELISCEDLLEENTLFSIPEQDYLDYILNKATFSNGLDLRNKYVHGSKSKNDNENFKDYLEFLLIMEMIIIKLNDEFCSLHP